MPVTVRRYQSATGLHLHHRQVDFTSSYPTNGEALTAADLGFTSKPTIVLAIPKGGFEFEYDYVNEKIKVYWSAAAGSALAEVTNATNLSTLTGVKVLAWGTNPS